MAKSAKKRFELAVEAYEHIRQASMLIAEAGVYNGDMGKSLNDLVTTLATGMQILDPDKYLELATRTAAADRDPAKQEIHDASGFVAQNRPGTEMYAGYI